MKWLFFLGICGISFLLLHSPDPRYNWAYFLILPSTIPMIFSIDKIIKKSFRCSYFYTFVLLSFFVIIVAFKKDPLFYEEKLLNMIEKGKITNPNIDSKIFLPPKLIPFSQKRFSHTDIELEPFRLIKMKAGNLDYFLPKTGNSCWNAPLPCAHIVLEENLKFTSQKFQYCAITENSSETNYSS